MRQIRSVMIKLEENSKNDPEYIQKVLGRIRDCFKPQEQKFEGGCVDPDDFGLTQEAGVLEKAYAQARNNR